MTPTPTRAEPLKENGHQFATGASVGFRAGSILHDKLVCLDCGIVRRPDGLNSPCKGKVRVTARNASALK